MWCYVLFELSLFNMCYAYVAPIRSWSVVSCIGYGFSSDSRPIHEFAICRTSMVLMPPPMQRVGHPEVGFVEH